MVVDSTNTHKGSLLSGLVPVLNPGIWADACRVLSVDLALFVGVVSTLLHADEPLIVSVPAVEGLVLGGESGITGSGANILDLVQEVLLLFVQFGDFGEENLRSQAFVGFGNVSSIEVQVSKRKLH